MNFYAPNYKEHLKEYFNQKKIFLIFFIGDKKLCPQTYYSQKVISISFKMNSEKALGKDSSFTQIYEILKDFPDLTLYMENLFWAYQGLDRLKRLFSYPDVLMC